MADLAAKFAENEITPNIIANPPAKLLNVSYFGSAFFFSLSLLIYSRNAFQIVTNSY